MAALKAIQLDACDLFCRDPGFAIGTGGGFSFPVAECLRGGGFQLLELAGEIRKRFLDAHALETAGAYETDGVGILNHAIRIGGRVDRSAVAEEEDVLTNAAGGVDDLLRALN